MHGNLLCLLCQTSLKKKADDYGEKVQAMLEFSREGLQYEYQGALSRQSSRQISC